MEHSIMSEKTEKKAPATPTWDPDKVRTAVVRRLQKNGWRHVYEVRSVYDPATKNTRVLASKLLGKLPPGVDDLNGMVPTDKRYSPVKSAKTEKAEKAEKTEEKASKRREAAVLSALLARESLGPKHQEAPGPDEETLTLCGRAAMRAPSHAKDFSVRLVSIKSRDRLAALYVARLPEDADDESKAKAADKAKKGAGLLALIMKKPAADADPREALEQAVTAGAALQSVLTVLQARGFAAKTVSACDFAEPDGLYDPEAETIVCFILCGTPKKALAKSPDPDLFKGKAKRGVLTLW